ncbi:MAG: adenylyl-sulfate kinase [Myxococcales bacterium]|nr:adenylyl-sulfate kinase [Myxococcales bacterium]
MSDDRNLTRTHSHVATRDRSLILGQKGAVIWLTGLSGSGKSTLAYALERRLIGLGKLTFALDGDNVRMGLCKDLGFKPEDRNENIRRIGEVASLFAEAGLLVLTSFISPYRADRIAAKATSKGDFIEVYLDVSVDVCEKRDPKGLYKKARAGEIANFTGVSAPYEEPASPDVRVNTDELTVEQCVDKIVDHLRERGQFDVSSLRAEAAQEEAERAQS